MAASTIESIWLGSRQVAEVLLWANERDSERAAMSANNGIFGAATDHGQSRCHWLFTSFKDIGVAWNLKDDRGEYIPAAFEERSLSSENWRVNRYTLTGKPSFKKDTK